MLVPRRSSLVVAQTPWKWLVDQWGWSVGCAGWELLASPSSQLWEQGTEPAGPVEAVDVTGLTPSHMPSPSGDMWEMTVISPLHALLLEHLLPFALRGFVAGDLLLSAVGRIWDEAWRVRKVSVF